MSILQNTVDRVLSWLEVFRPKSIDTGHLPIDGRYLHVMLDLAERCNLRCTHCAFVYWRDEILEGTQMSDELIAKLGREVFPHAHRVSLSCFHEALVAPNRLLRAIAACRSAGVERIDFITNGLLYTEKLARQIFEAGPKRIYFSVDGASSETYDKVRVGGTFEQFKEKVAMVSRVRDAMGLDGGKVELAFITCMMRSNIHEAVKMVDFAADNKIDSLELRYLMKSDAAPIAEDELLCHIPELADEWYEKAIARAAERGVYLELLPTRFRDAMKNAHLVTGPPPYRDCGFPSNTLVLSPKGHVYPCCLWHGNDQLDDVSMRPFEEVWNGRPMRTLRRELMSGRLSRQNCKDCIVHRDMSDPKYWGAYHFRV